MLTHHRLACALAVALVVGGCGGPDGTPTSAPSSVSAGPAAKATPISCEEHGDDESFVWYVMAKECAEGLTGVSATVILPQPPPRFDRCGAQSNGQITLDNTPSRGSGKPRQAIEVSWVVRPGVNGGKPFLQVGRTIGAQEAGADYPSKDWVSTGNKPQPAHPASGPGDFPLDFGHLETLDGSTVDFGIRYSDAGGGRWQVWVGDSANVIGYYPDAAFGPDGFKPRQAAWWGEVQVQRSDQCNREAFRQASCTGMGNGVHGNTVGAAGFTKLRTYDRNGERSEPASRQIYVTDPNLYGSNRYANTQLHVPGDFPDEPFTGDSFYYGGPGYCPKPTANPVPRPVPNRSTPAAPPVEAGPPADADPPSNEPQTCGGTEGDPPCPVEGGVG